MTAPIIFYMFLNAFAPVVINDNFITTIIFEEPFVMPNSGASKGQLFLKKGPNSKTLFLQSKGKDLFTNLNVMTKSGKLYSFLIQTGSKPHSIITIKDGKKDKVFKDVKKTKEILIEEGSFVTRVINRSNKMIQINSINIPIKRSYEFPKGAPIFLNKKRVHR